MLMVPVVTTAVVVLNGLVHRTAIELWVMPPSKIKIPLPLPQARFVASCTYHILNSAVESLLFFLDQ